MNSEKTTIYWPEKHVASLEKIKTLATANDKAVTAMIRWIAIDWLENLEKEKEKENA